VTVEYSYGKPKRIEALVIGAHHDPDPDNDTIRHDIIQKVIKPVIPADMMDKNTKIYLTAQGVSRWGALFPIPVSPDASCWWIPTAATRATAAAHSPAKIPPRLTARHLYGQVYRKNCVAAGLADRLELQVPYSIGVAHPLSVSIETFGTGKIPDASILKLIHKHFDMRPGPSYGTSTCAGLSIRPLHPTAISAALTLNSLGKNR
jgi:S-adenosylmethionine synthetase